MLGFLSDTKESTLQATPLRPQEVSRILGRVDELATQEEENETPYVEGESVKVIDGPFASFVGTIEKVDNERKNCRFPSRYSGVKLLWN